MTIDPNTTVGQLMNALPSTMPILQSYGISPQQVLDKPLWKALVDVHVDMDKFLHAVDEIDWSAESLVKEERSPERG
jgi:hypothetical protein